MRKQTETENEIIRQTLRMFYEGTDLPAHAHPPTKAEPEFKSDVLVEVTTKTQTWKFPAIVMANISPANIGAVLSRMAPVIPNGLLLTRYVTPTMAEELREKKIQFLDTAGNAFLNAPPLYVLVKGKRPVVAVGVEKTKRAFRPSGLQVLFALLLQPALAEAPYREVARIADVALGTVGWVLRDLKELGYLIDMGTHGRRLTRKEDLLTRWVTTYPDQLRPKLVIGRFKATNPNWEKDAGDLSLQGACWGGEPAAAIITGQLKPAITTIYTRGNANEFIIRNKLRKDPQGDIELLKTFWIEAIQKKYGDQAPPLVVYADLIATADPRNIEIAKILYELKINELVREN